MSSVIDYAKQWVVTCPDDDVPASLLEWADGKATLPVSEHASLDRIVREWWREQTDARELLGETIAVDQRTGVLGACACARWALERYWQSDDRRPWISVETTEAWCRGKAMTHHVVGAAHHAQNAVGVATKAKYVALYAGYAADTGSMEDAVKTADIAAVVAANAAGNATKAARGGVWLRAKAEALRELCDVVRAAIECPPAEVWLASELKRNSQ